MHYFKQKKLKHLPLTFKNSKVSIGKSTDPSISVGFSKFHDTEFFIYSKTSKPISKCIDIHKTKFKDE